MLGLDKYASREIAYKRENKNELNKTYSELIVLRIIMLIITTIIYIIFSIFSEYRMFLLLQSIYVIGYLVDISWLYNGLEEFKKTVLRSIIIKILNILCIFIFIKEPSDLWKYILINGILLLFGNLSLYFNIKKYVKLEKVKLKDVMKHVPMTLQIFIPQLAIQLYLQLGKIMIEAITGNAVDVGYYDQADKIVKLPMSLITALSTVMLPRVSNEIKKKNNEKVNEYINTSLVFSFFIGIPIMVGLFSIADTLVPWLLGQEYMPVIKTIQILSPIILALCLTNVLGDQYMMAANKTKELTLSYIVGVVVNFVFNIFLIKQFSYIGAAIGMIITELSIIAIQIKYTNNVIEKKFFTKNAFKYAISSLIMIIPIMFVKRIGLNIVVTTFVQIIIGGVTYFAMLFVLKDNFFYTYCKKIVEKIVRKGEK